MTGTLLADGEAAGTVRPTRDGPCAVLWDLSAVVLGAHLRRALAEPDPAVAMARYGEVAVEIYTDGSLIDPPSDRRSP